MSTDVSVLKVIIAVLPGCFSGLELIECLMTCVGCLVAFSVMASRRYEETSSGVACH